MRPGYYRPAAPYREPDAECQCKLERGSVSGDFKSATVSSVAAAMVWAAEACGSNVPVAARIDTMLHWRDVPGGGRPADWKLREVYPKARASIMSPNALSGSMGVGGMALALRLREKWPAIRLNETHPKVLMHALGVERCWPSCRAGCGRKWAAQMRRWMLRRASDGSLMPSLPDAEHRVPPTWTIRGLMWLGEPRATTRMHPRPI
jgi:Protein of unknown function (DUF429)